MSMTTIYLNTLISQLAKRNVILFVGDALVDESAPSTHLAAALVNQ